MLTHEHVTQSAAYLREKLPFTPEIGIVLGSGLGPLAEEIEQPVCFRSSCPKVLKVSTVIVIVSRIPTSWNARSSISRKNSVAGFLS